MTQTRLISDVFHITSYLTISACLIFLIVDHAAHSEADGKRRMPIVIEGNQYEIEFGNAEERDRAISELANRVREEKVNSTSYEQALEILCD